MKKKNFNMLRADTLRQILGHTVFDELASKLIRRYSQLMSHAGWISLIIMALSFTLSRPLQLITICLIITNLGWLRYGEKSLEKEWLTPIPIESPQTLGELDGIRIKNKKDTASTVMRGLQIIQPKTLGLAVILMMIFSQLGVSLMFLVTISLLPTWLIAVALNCAKNALRLRKLGANP